MGLKHSFPFDPTYGYNEARLRTIKSPLGPTDFIRFWEFTYDKMRRIPLRVERRQVASPDPQFELYEVEFDSLDGVRIGGWITVPANGKYVHGVVVGHETLRGARGARCGGPSRFSTPPRACKQDFPKKSCTLRVVGPKNPYRNLPRAGREGDPSGSSRLSLLTIFGRGGIRKGRSCRHKPL
jgi:hypothetical protein